MNAIFSLSPALRLVALLCTLYLMSSAHAADKRIALVIGNAQYQNEKALRNPVNDAGLIARTLKNDLAFDEVIEKNNLDRRGLVNAISQLANKAKGSDSIVVYYSGHGMQASGVNYLIPVDASISDPVHIRSEGISSTEITDILNDSGARVALLILDACRDNPYNTRAKTVGKGLTRMSIRSGNMLIAYATQEGDIADDGTENNSPYAQALANNLKRRDLKVLEVFDEVADEVERKTGKQRPTRYGDLKSSVYLSPFGKVPNNALEKEMWDVCKNAKTAESCKAYINDYPSGVYKKLANLRLSELSPTASTATITTVSAQPAENTLKAGSTFKDCPDCPEMVILPSGSFQMGSNEKENEKPVHSVSIKAFAMGKTEVTQGQWQAVMGNNPSDSKHCGTRCPVNVSWDDAREFIKKLNAKTGKTYRLPSEAEWEYACRAGSNQTYCGSDNVDSVAVYAPTVMPIDLMPVGSKQANAWGLFDMSGNLAEWTQDCIQYNYVGAPRDGKSWQYYPCPMRVYRGGSFHRHPEDVRAASRTWVGATLRVSSIGFRVARTVP